MSEHIHPLFDDMYAIGGCSDRQPLAEFILQVRRHLWAIRTSQDTLRSLSSLFASGQRVWPSACNDTIESLTSVGEHSRKFHAFIEHSIHLPLVVIPLRLPLLLTLKNIDLQIIKLNQLLAVLRDGGKTALSQPAEDRRVIVGELDVLMLHSEQAIQQAEDLLCKAKEREYSKV